MHIRTIYNSIKPTVHKISTQDLSLHPACSNTEVYTDGSYHILPEFSAAKKENVCLVDVTFNQSFPQVQAWDWSERFVIKYTCHTRD